MLTLGQQLRVVFALTWTWIKREPWMFTPYIFVWYVTHTEQERTDHVRRMLGPEEKT